MRLKRLAALMALLISICTFSPFVSAETDSSGVTDFVTRLYSLALERQPDEQGLQQWSDLLLQRKATGISVAYGFIYSSEYQSRDISDDQYTELMYEMFFGRASDPDGKASWLTVLAEYPGSAGREKLFYGFANSVEFAALCSSYGIIRGDYAEGRNIDNLSATGLFVDRLYRLVLGRDCDTAGMTDWTLKLLNGEITGTQAGYGFFASPEYLDRGRSDAEYIDDLYNAFMGRPADEAGRDAWLSVLASGTSRDEVFNGFAMSSEFGTICDQYGIVRGDKIRLQNQTSHVVCIDPGHSSVVASGNVPIGPGSSVMKLADTSGTYGRWSGLHEYELNLMIAQQLKAELESRGYTVIMTREDNRTPVDCVTRAQIANNNAELSIRLHADALDSSSANGAVAICITSHNAWNPQTYSGSRLLADSLISEYCSSTGIRNRGVSEQDDMTGNNWSTVPCVLFEMGFMTNQSDDLNMSNPQFQVRMVQGLANGIDRYFENAG